MLRIRRFPRVLLSISTVGVIFAFFSLFFKDKWLFGAGSLIVALLIYSVYLLSYDYKASYLMQKAKKYLDKNEVDKANKCIVESAKLNPDEENLLKIFGHQNKNLDAFNVAASKLQKQLNDYDTPFMRFIIASFLYFNGDLKKVKELLIGIPSDRRTIKMVRLLGSALYDMKDYNGSIAVLSFYDPPSLPTNEDELAVAFGLGIAYLSIGDKDKALDYLLRVETRNAKFGNVSKILATLDEKDK